MKEALGKVQGFLSDVETLKHGVSVSAVQVGV